MAFIRPIVQVIRQFTNAAVSVIPQELGTLIVGPAFHIEDYNDSTDKTNIYVNDYTKSGYDADAACSANGSSLGRPAAGDFVTLTEPPNHISGATLDSGSVKVMFDGANIELDHGADGAIAAGSNEFSAATAHFTANSAKSGDRIIMTGNSKTVVKTIKEIVDNTHIKLASTNKDNITGYEDEWVGVSSILWRVEHTLNDQEIESANFSISGQSITITTPGSGILVTYENGSYPVNFGRIYIGYRELRADLQTPVEVTAANYLATLGKLDERNPLAVGAYVALSNTSTPIKVAGVETDDLTGHTKIRDIISSMFDIFAIVPTTASLGGSDWTNVINMWKNDAVAKRDPSISKYRVIIGSYPELPTEKSSTTPSIVGTTKPSDASNDPFDVFVDPSANTKMVTSGVGSTHLLDIAHNNTSGFYTLGTGEHIFNATYSGAKTLRGAMGEKRIRVTDADKFSAGFSALSCSYTVRAAILKSEGGTTIAEDTSSSATNDGGGYVKITAGTAGAFINVAVGDVMHIRNATVAGYKGGWLVTSKADSSNIVLALVYTSDATVNNAEIYRGETSGTSATTATGPNAITKTGAFVNAAPGDIIYVTDDSANAGNVGMWIVSSKVDDDKVLVTGGGDNLAAGTTANFIMFESQIVSNGAATATVRQRLTRLEDNTASFTSTVLPGEYIEIPYPTDTDSAHWDTTKTAWPIDTIIDDNRLDASLEELEELAPKDFIAGFSGDCAYRIAITLNKPSQITELNSIVSAMADLNLIMVWPDSVKVSSVKNNLTGKQNRLSGQYLACAVGGMTAGLPSHQGFTFIGIAGISRIYNANDYFTDDQLTLLRNGGWYVFVQDNEASTPYTIHEVTTDVTSYDYGEYMAVKNFYYVSAILRDICAIYRGRYNINAQTLALLQSSLERAAATLENQVYDKIGTRLIAHNVAYVKQSSADQDHIQAKISLTMPPVSNTIELTVEA